MRFSLFKMIFVLLVGFILFSCSKKEDWIELMNAPNLASWRQDRGEWFEAGKAYMNPKNEKLIATEPGHGVAVNGLTGHTKHLFTVLEHGDCELHVEFMVPKGSNSGVYLMGRYEVQVRDTWGVKEPKSSDCGGIYQRWKDGKGFEGHAPLVNASLPAGQWQEYDIYFRAPRFDKNEEKTANAKFLKVVQNGQVVQENVEVTGPTRAAAFQDEQPLGPLMLQGDHGPVAYRNVRIRPLK